jgi:hypothetical protein
MTASYLNLLTDTLAMVDHEITVALEDRDMRRADALMGDADKLATRIDNQRKAMGEKPQ